MLIVYQIYRNGFSERNTMSYLSSNPRSQLLSAREIAQHRHARCADFKQFHTEKCSHMFRTALQKCIRNTLGFQQQMSRNLLCFNDSL